jgi:erythromycin esterase-like protein
MRRDGLVGRDEFFFAEQNARLVKNAEEYYREMFRGRVSSWNLRDCHMTDTLFALADHLRSQNIPAKIVVWAHNSHLGDARATEMGAGGEWSVGQLTRQRAEARAYLIGFTTYAGTVTAATNWDEPAQLKRVRPGLKDSFELLFHEVEMPRFFLELRDPAVIEMLARPRLERAIGVIYRPETERLSHYFHAHLTMQFDAVVHFDHTRGVEPLDSTSSWKHDDLPETFPAGV